MSSAGLKNGRIKVSAFYCTSIQVAYSSLFGLSTSTRITAGLYTACESFNIFMLTSIVTGIESIGEFPTGLKR